MKFFIALLTFSISVMLLANIDVNKLQNDYPHWNLKDKESLAKLVKIDTFIKENSNKNYLAVFDWDGTLFCEHIPVKEMNNKEYAGQPAFYLWGAFNHDKIDGFKIFPMFDTNDGKFSKNVEVRTKTQEGGLFDGMQNTVIPPEMPTKPYPKYSTDEYSKFSQTAIFTAGMTPEQVRVAENEFFLSYPPEKYAFLPMFDVMQKMCNSGYDVWIITGSSPYFVDNELNYIQHNIIYRDGKKYDFSKIINTKSGDYNEKNTHIIGNGLKLLNNGEFSVMYNSKWLENKFINASDLLYVVDRQGKYIVVKNLENEYHKSIAFVAGNTDGDLYDTSYCLQESKLAPKTFTICVAPPTTSQIYSYLQKHPNNSSILTMPEAYPQGDK